MKKLWLAFALVLLFSFSVLGWIGTRIYQEAPPLPDQVVAILGQTHPKLIIYDRAAKKFSEVEYPSAKPNVWYGTEAIDGRHIFLFDRGGAGVIKWDTQTDSGKAIPWPYKAPFPVGGRFEAQDKAIWCRVWETGYRPLGIARLGVEKNEFTGFHAFPQDDDGLKPFTNPATTLFLPFTLKGKVVPFDFKEKRWCKFLDVPQYGKLFGFMGGPISHKGRYYFSLSTYNGTDTGCDGKPYHFCNAILEFDPQTRRFEFLTLEASDAYHQIAYMLSAKGEFFATGSNIREKDGKLNRDRAGEVVFWQTMKPSTKRTLEFFKKNLDTTLTPAKTVAAFGEPDRKLGSGLIIYEYDLDDGTKLRLGFPGFAPIQYAHHVQKNGKFTVIPVK